MGFELTEEQKQVRDLRNNNLLVSAAAGSGKTAVLVERIKSLINDKDNPVGIDSFLIVTFTRAAAAEMKERIYNNLTGVDKKLVPYANITTIDGFCSKVLRDHFNEVGISPNFAVYSEDELKLLENECLDELMEEKLGEKDDDFLRLCEYFVKRESLNPLKQSVFAIFKSSDSMPWPREWLLGLKDNYSIKDENDLINCSWYRDFLEYIRVRISDILLEEKHFLRKYSDEFMSDVDALTALLDLKNEDFILALKSFSFPTLRLKKIDGDEKKKAQKEREVLKKAFGEVANLAVLDNEDLIERLNGIFPVVNSLVDLVIAFRERLFQKKLKKNKFSFSDVEHFALNVLRDEKTKEITESAKVLRDSFSHIMVDEYQDSNYLQEAILSSIVKTGEESNYFMVGDVKQSIYRFRKARPDLFTDKYDAFKSGVPHSTAIDLSKNFRSRQSVTNVVNSVFEKIMKRDLGSIEYDNDQRLCFSATYYSEDKEYNKTEAFLVNSEDEYFKLKHIDKDTAEAMLIGSIIKEKIVGKVLVTDGSTLRPARYSDIVILHRAANEVGNKYVEAIKNMGIPILSAGKKGYFESYEINCLVAFLNLLNNPFNDIALAGVLKNFFEFTENDLLRIRQNRKDGNFSDNFFELAEELGGKYKDFVDAYNEFRNDAKKKRLYEVLQNIIIKTEFNKKILSLPGGKDRISNIEKLVDLAIKFEGFGSGLFDFVKYISDIKDFEIDLPLSVSAPKDSVTLMTIHKSKGLEFPICILAGNLKQIRSNDKSRGGISISEKYGLGLDFVDIKMNTKRTNPLKESIKLFENMENRAEAIRLLYVALTRAKEKLIITGSGKMEDISRALESRDTDISATKRLKAQSALDLLMPGLVDLGISPVLVSGQEISDNLLKEESGEENRDVPNVVKGENSPKQYGEYPILQRKLMAKYSVSELKKVNESDTEYNEDSDTGDLVTYEREFVPYIPSFIKEKEEEIRVSGAERGTAYHKIMEIAEFKEGEDIIKLLEKSTQNGYLNDIEKSAVNPKDIETFFLSDLGKRMCRAQSEGNLFREKFFVMSLLSKELFPNLDFSLEEDRDTTLVQGVIDGYFLEDDGIVLMDYKTDGLGKSVSESFEDELVLRYKKQLELYSKALTKATGLKVKEVYIYSFALGREIKLEI